MKVLGIDGSPREGKGNTEIVVRKALDVCKGNGLETEFVAISDLKVEYCDHCNDCLTEPKCSKDDDVESILERMEEADAIIIGSPTYFGSVPGKLKSLLDRTVVLRRHGLKLSGKIGGAIVVGGSRNGGQEFTIMTIRNWMLMQEMLVVGDKETAHFGGICVGRKRGEVLGDKEGIKTVENLGKKMVEVLKRD
ncbi:hypothetical protein BEH94_10555 [Candidatus Altiarchaeales archaeon WOR_SM1_SCG]|nr:hypothetical protein BEH94_10555 [Candidatus Altiarchaeales archaeon WOR_SM1_SCG]